MTQELSKTDLDSKLHHQDREMVLEASMAEARHYGKHGGAVMASHVAALTGVEIRELRERLDAELSRMDLLSRAIVAYKNMVSVNLSPRT